SSVAAARAAREVVAVPGALDDIVVIELTTELWSRLAGALLGDFGARVVRIDDPGCDPSPVGIYEPRTPATWRALADLADRNKRSVAVHLGTVDGCALAARLVRKADVVLTDWPVDRLVTAGLDADARRGADPRPVYAPGGPPGRRQSDERGDVPQRRRPLDHDDDARHRHVLAVTRVRDRPRCGRPAVRHPRAPMRRAPPRADRRAGGGDRNPAGGPLA